MKYCIQPNKCTVSIHFTKFYILFRKKCRFCSKPADRDLQFFFHTVKFISTIILLNPEVIFFENTVDPDQLASDEAISSGSIMFSIFFVFTYSKTCVKRHLNKGIQNKDLNDKW